MHIRFVLPDAYRVGGTVRTVFNLAEVLAKTHDVEVASLTPKRAEPALRAPSNVRLVSLGSFRALIAYIRAAHDGVLIGTRPRINMAMALLARSDVMTVGQEHFYLNRHPARKRLVMRTVYRRLDAHVSLTSRDAEAFQELLGARGDARWIPNGIEDQKVERSSVDLPLAVAAGRLTLQKGFDLLLPAWQQVVEAHPEWRLRIFGEGEQRDSLQALIERLDIGEHTELAGFTDQLPDELARGSFFVLSSRFEGLPMVLLEAMSCGLPVVSFDCPTGPRDVVEEGLDGFLVPPQDIGALAQAMLTMVEADSARADMAEAAYTKSLDYRMPVVAARWEALLAELSDLRGRRRRMSKRATA